ncbi:MFS transporter [Catenuloplanes atrovinosus]|uniref:MFS family arabinose efflux permease n=1 Tax=Catenuloplanes atrovinosus TaxID=137266 RepID=A0AAE3YN35_9ACTN|nr:MFS transporter [Catenuloplanes atrovinosus]MDR7276530.1 putative MFS family arabinose efflux permease [Catenuloplanes atrovinosus]
MTATLTAPAPALTITAQRRPWISVYAVMFFSTWAGNQFSPLLLLYKQREHYSALAVNGFLGVYVLGLAPAFVLSGALSDRYGRRPVMFGGVLAALAASTALAFGGTGPVMICVGRLLAGIAVGTATCVGTSWLKELSQGVYDPRADAGAGARRATTSFSLGSAAGALVAGLFAQWGPWPLQLPFVIHVLLTLPFAWLVLRAPETAVTVGAPTRSRVPTAGHPRFVRVVMVAAPWLFVAPSVTFGYLPVLLEETTPGAGIAYATLLTVLALGVSALIQPWAKRLVTTRTGPGLVAAILLITAGVTLAAIADHARSWPLGLLVAVVMGCGIGVGMVCAILEVQRIAGPGDLAALTGVFYAIAYTGFLTPAVLAALTGALGSTAPLLGVATLGLLSALLLIIAHRRTR